jgi:Chitobiase/beta-hexosaminidase C-terminal domain
VLTNWFRFKGCSPRGTGVALLSVLTNLLFVCSGAVAQTISISQQTWGANETNSAAPFASTTVATSGGAWGSASAGGHSAAVNTFGVFVAGTSTGGFVEQFTNQNAAMTVVGESDILPGGIAIDRNNYLYISGESSNVVYKIPVNTTANGAYGVGTYGPITSACPNSTSCAFLGSGSGSTGTPPPACAGDGQSPDVNGICQINLGNGNYGFNIASLAIDSNHNLFFTTDANAGSATPSAPYSVFVCNVACLYPAAGTTPAPVQIYVEPAGSGGQLYTGAIAVDQNDNIYFTDSFISSSGTTAGYSAYADLYQVTYNSTSKTWAATPTLLATLTPACVTPATGTPCNDAITTVAVDATGNVYFGTELDGVFKIANNGSALAGNPPVIAISGEGAKTIVPDGKGNFYFMSTNPATQDDTAGFLATGSVVDTAQAWSAEPATAGSVSNVSAVDGGSACSATSKLTFVEDATDYGFSGVETTGSSCSTLPFASGSSFPVTVTFTPSTSEAGPYSTTMTATNVADADTGTFPVSGVAAISQTITVTSPAAATTKVNYGVAPVALAATATSGLPVVFTTTTPTVCTGLNTDTVTFINNGTCTIDANQPGNSQYAPAPQVVITFTVAALSQRITNLTATSIPYTTTPIPLVATSSNTTSSAAPICFTYDSGPGTVSNQAVGTTGPPCFPPQALTITGTGTVVITAAQAASPGFSATSLVAQFKVTSAPQSISLTSPSGTLATAPATIVYGSTLTLAATGGASGNPVTFTIDPSSTGTGTISTGGVLTATGLGTLVIDANQAASPVPSTGGSSNYAAATQVQAFLTVVPVSPTTVPLISPASGTTMYLSGNLNVVSISDPLAGATIYYTTDGSTPTLSSTVYTAPFTLTNPGSATINAIAIAPGYALSSLATSTYTVSNASANFTASVAPASVTVSPSSPGIVAITVTPQYGFNTATTFTCSTVPSTLTCSFNPATVTPANGQSASTALTIATSGSAALQGRSNPFLPGGATLAIAVCFLGWKKRRGLVVTLVLIACAIGAAQLTGCGGSSSSAPTTSNVVVTAASGKVTQTIQIAVTVNQ